MLQNAIKDDEHQANWEFTHACITDAYVTLFAEFKRPPTQQEIADRCSIARCTVSRHISELSLDDVRPSVKLRTSRVLHGLTTQAEKGSAPEVKLWFQLVHDWHEKSEVRHSGTIKLENVDVRKLSIDKLDRIAQGENPDLVLADTRN